MNRMFDVGKQVFLQGQTLQSQAHLEKLVPDLLDFFEQARLETIEYQRKHVLGACAKSQKRIAKECLICQKYARRELQRNALFARHMPEENCKVMPPLLEICQKRIAKECIICQKYARRELQRNASFARNMPEENCKGMPHLPEICQKHVGL
ncbi:hypothetical protein CHS0354_041131 [Potamilus streckersoni]|uniref:Uncharacterized protein n=1 Tax=Potamilus streckersoni TaxID=2493646 RepID=A0AAE0VUW5_9BIVA|nr:hypothetical protein CHS0354_041131 [Potamilus streckersoni]